MAKPDPTLFDNPYFQQLFDFIMSGTLSLKDIKLTPIEIATIKADPRYQESVQDAEIGDHSVVLAQSLGKWFQGITPEAMGRIKRRETRRKRGQEERSEDYSLYESEGLKKLREARRKRLERRRLLGLGPSVPYEPGTPIPIELTSSSAADIATEEPSREEIVESIAKGLGPDYADVGTLARELAKDKYTDTKSKSKYTRGEALRITNQMAANRDPNWKAFWKEQEKLGFSDKEDPSLAEGAKEVWKWLTKDRPKRETDKKPTTRRRGSPRKKGGVVNKRVTKQYAKGGSVRTPKRVK